MIALLTKKSIYDDLNLKHDSKIKDIDFRHTMINDIKSSLQCAVTSQKYYVYLVIIMFIFHCMYIVQSSQLYQSLCTFIIQGFMPHFTDFILWFKWT